MNALRFFLAECSFELWARLDPEAARFHAQLIWECSALQRRHGLLRRAFRLALRDRRRLKAALANCRKYAARLESMALETAAAGEGRPDLCPAIELPAGFTPCVVAPYRCVVVLDPRGAGCPADQVVLIASAACRAPLRSFFARLFGDWGRQ